MHNVTPVCRSRFAIFQARTRWSVFAFVLISFSLPGLFLSPPTLHAANKKIGKNKTLKRVFKALKSPRYKVRMQAVAVLAKSGDPRAVEAIAVLLTDSEPLVQATVCDALLALGDPSVLPRLTRLLQSDDDLVRRRARLAVRVLKEKQGAALPGAGTQAPNFANRGGDDVLPKLVSVDDPTNSGFSGLDQALRQGLSQGLKSRQSALLSVQIHYALRAQVRSVKPVVADDQSRVEVTCHITVVELPRNSLRLSTQVTAAAAQSGRANKADQEELARDAARGTGEALAEAFVSWAAGR